MNRFPLHKCPLRIPETEHRDPTTQRGETTTSRLIGTSAPEIPDIRRLRVIKRSNKVVQNGAQKLSKLCGLICQLLQLVKPLRETQLVLTLTEEGNRGRYVRGIQEVVCK